MKEAALYRLLELIFTVRKTISDAEMEQAIEKILQAIKSG